MPVPTLATRLKDAVSVRVDQAGALETVAIVALRDGRLERAVLALRKAQAELCAGELELLERIRVESLKPRPK